MRLLTALFALVTLGLASCSTWRPAGEYEAWRLYVQDGAAIEPAEYERTVVPALLAVEQLLGPFRERVDIHAADDVEGLYGGRGRLSGSDSAVMQHVPGIGPVRIGGFHRLGNGPLASSGVFVGTPDPGTMVHELVHARLAERPDELPLWFEEGYATLIGDGVLKDGRWTVDGLSCWPWLELSEKRFTDGDLARLLAIEVAAPHTVRENVLLHWVGWAVVFDLFRETGEVDPDLLLHHFRHAGDPVREARARLERTLDSETPRRWLEERLEDADPGVRMAAAQGTYKLGSRAAVVLMLRALDDEEDVEARVAFSINCLATAGERRLGWRLDGWMWRSILPVLREAKLEDPAETRALRDLYRAYRRGSRRVDTQESLNALQRFWKE